MPFLIATFRSQALNLITPGYIRSLWVPPGETAPYIGGFRGADPAAPYYFAHWTGSAFTRVTLPLPGTVPTYNTQIEDISGTDGTHIWLTSPDNQNLTWSFNGTTATLETPFPSGVGLIRALSLTAEPSGSVWIGGQFIATGSDYDVIQGPAPWAQYTLPVGGGNTIIYEIWALDTRGVGETWYAGWVGGPYQHAARLHDEAAPSPARSGELHAIWVASTTPHVFAAGHYGSFPGVADALYYDSAAWNVLPTFPLPSGTVDSSWEGIRGTSLTDVWAAGFYSTDGILYGPLVGVWDGSGWADVSPPLPTGATQGYLYCIWPITSTDVWAAGGWNDGTNDHLWVLHWDGAAWADVSPTS